MRAVVFTGDGVRVDDVDLPSIQEPTDAIVKVSVTAICGSDLHLLDGKTPGMRVGGVIGHEFVGTIHDTGPDVSKHSEGMRVLGSFLIACGVCASCAAGRHNFCTARRALGLGTLTGDLDGAQAEYVRVPNADVNLKALDGALSGLSNEEALFGGDVLTTGFYAAGLAEAGPSDVVAIVGAGPIGLFTAAALEGRAERVVVLDTDGGRVRFASSILRTATAHEVSDGDAQAVIEAATGGRAADVAVDAVGTIPAFKSAMRCVREGGRIVVIGVYGAERYEFPMGMAWIRGLDIRFGGMADIQSNWDKALMTVAKGELDPTALISHRLPLEQAPEGYDLFASREATKVVLTP